MLTEKIHKIPLYTKDGKYIDVDVKVVPGKWNDQDAYYSINVDISEKKELEGRFQLLFNFNPTAVLVSRIKDGEILDVNDSFLKLIKKSRERVVGKPWHDIHLWESEAQRKKFVQKLIRNSCIEDQEMTISESIDNSLYFLYSAQLIKINKEDCAFIAINDITDRVIFERKIQRSYVQESLLAKIAKILNKERSDNRAFSRVASLMNDFVPSNRIMIFKVDEYAQYPISPMYGWINKGFKDKGGNVETIKKLNVDELKECFDDNTYRYYEPQDSFERVLKPIMKVLDINHGIVIALKVFNKIDRFLIIDRDGIEAGNDDSTKYFLKTVQNLLSIYYEQLMSQEKIQQDYEELKNTKDAVLNVFEDVAEQKRISDALANDLKKFNLAVENATDEIFIANPDLTGMYENPVMMSSHTDILGVHFHICLENRKSKIFSQKCTLYC
jgi:PAS domain S-box-containing protein